VPTHALHPTAALSRAPRPRVSASVSETESATSPELDCAIFRVGRPSVEDPVATSAKEKILESLAALPATATIEDAMERLYFLRKIERGVADADAGRVVPHEDVAKRFAR